MVALSSSSTGNDRMYAENKSVLKPSPNMMCRIPTPIGLSRPSCDISFTWGRASTVKGRNIAARRYTNDQRNSRLSQLRTTAHAIIELSSRLPMIVIVEIVMLIASARGALTSSQASLKFAQRIRVGNSRPDPPESAWYLRDITTTKYNGMRIPSAGRISPIVPHLFERVAFRRIPSTSVAADWWSGGGEAAGIVVEIVLTGPPAPGDG